MTGSRFRIVSILMVLSMIIGIFLISKDRNQTYLRFEKLFDVYMIDKQTHSKNHDVTSITNADMGKRLDIKTTACRHLDNVTDVKTIMYTKKAQQYRPHITFLRQFNISYCSVGKTGGTFIKQIFSILMNGVNVTKTLESQSRHSTYKALLKYHAPFNSQGWRRSRLIIVARNPYTRLFSAYIDRVSIPSITNEVRNGSRCRFGVSLQEFLEIVVRNTKRGIFDNHWSPIYYICRSCDMTTAFIAKMESFTTDIRYTIDHLNISKKTRTLIESKLVEPSIGWTLIGIIKATLVTGDKTFLRSGCIGWFGALKRLWTAFQVQGYINDAIDFPTRLYNNTDDISNVDIFLKTVFSTIDNNPMSMEEQKQQRKRALVKAYAEVDENTIEQIKTVYRPDFELFGYSKEPPSFNNKRS